jgi:hypothetical protein
MPRPLACFVVALLTTVAHAAPPVDFAHDVLPILRDRCAQCHTNGTYKGSLSLDTREALLKAEVVVSGDAASSDLLERITSNDPDVRMPPKGERLTAREVDVLRRWIDTKLPWQSGFSFARSSYAPPLAPREVELPPAMDGRTHPIDRLVDAYLTRHGIERPVPLDDAAYLRRVSLDLVGLLPTNDELDAFLADERPDKRIRLVKSLLASDRRYAEHWLTFWNDLLRNDYVGTGFIDGGRKPITNWLYRALSENEPYDQFARALIAPSPESEGFIAGIKWRGNVNASQVREIQFAQNVGQVFLGVNLKCASCHDSFIDGWRLEHAYGLAAVIADEPLEIHRCDKPTGEFAHAAFPYPELGEIDPNATKEQRLVQTADLLTSSENGRFARTIVNRLWDRLLGRGVVHPVDIMSNEPWSEDLIDFLAADLAAHGHDLKRTLELITTSSTYQSRSLVLAEEPDAGEFVFRGPLAKRMTAEQYVDAIWRITGTAPRATAKGADFGDRGDEPVRASLVPADLLMRSLGRPNREQVVTTRPADLSTLEALDLENGEILAGLLARGAINVRSEHPDATTDELATWLFLRALQREPSADELAIARRLAGDPATNEGLADLLWAVFALPEFQLVR